MEASVLYTDEALALHRITYGDICWMVILGEAAVHDFRLLALLWPGACHISALCAVSVTALNSGLSSLLSLGMRRGPRLNSRHLRLHVQRYISKQRCHNSSDLDLLGPGPAWTWTGVADLWEFAAGSGPAAQCACKA